MQDYQPNSHKYKKEQAEAANNERKKVEKVVTGKVKTKKKSEVSKFADVFISEDAANVKSYIIFDVLVPTIVDTIRDIAIGSLDMIFGRGTGRSRKRSSGSSNASYVSYRSYSDNRDDRRDNYRERMRSRFAFDDIIIDNKGEAEDVLDHLDALIDQYDQASVADLYDLVGVSPEYTDHKYGWTNLANASVERVRGGGYILRLPRPQPIGR